MVNEWKAMKESERITACISNGYSFFLFLFSLRAGEKKVSKRNAFEHMLFRDWVTPCRRRNG